MLERSSCVTRHCGGLGVTVKKITQQSEEGFQEFHDKIHQWEETDRVSWIKRNKMVSIKGEFILKIELTWWWFCIYYDIVEKSTKGKTWHDKILNLWKKSQILSELNPSSHNTRWLHKDRWYSFLRQWWFAKIC